MRFTTYRDKFGNLQMMSDDSCLEALRELGRTFADGMAQIDKPVTDQSDLWNGLAAYHLLKLEGENARIDAAHKRVIRMVTDASFERAREIASAS